MNSSQAHSVLPQVSYSLPVPCLTAMAEGFITCGCTIYIEQDKEGGRDLYLEAESKTEMEFWKRKLYNKQF